MKGSGFAAWKARLDFMAGEHPFSRGGVQRHFDDDGRLHRDDGPAWISPTRVIWYQHGRKHGIDADIHGSLHYYYENVRIPPLFHRAIRQPRLLTVREVLRHTNTECRYVGMRIIGLDRVREDSRCSLVDLCPSTGMELFAIQGILRDPVCYLKVVNATPEADGSRKPYFLCVPPTVQTCAEAVAWTFRLPAEDYHPSQET